MDSWAIHIQINRLWVYSHGAKPQPSDGIRVTYICGENQSGDSLLIISTHQLRFSEDYWGQWIDILRANTPTHHYSPVFRRKLDSFFTVLRRAFLGRPTFQRSTMQLSPFLDAEQPQLDVGLYQSRTFWLRPMTPRESKNISSAQSRCLIRQHGKRHR